MSRELHDNFFSLSDDKKEETNHFPKKELMEELEELRLQVKNAQGSSVFVYSKLVQLFNKIKKYVDQVDHHQKQVNERILGQIEFLQKEIRAFNIKKEEAINQVVENILDQQNKITEKHSVQLKDLSQSVNLQYEKVWHLSNQVEEIKEDIHSKDPLPPSK